MVANPLRKAIATAYTPDTGFADLLARPFVPRAEAEPSPLAGLLGGTFVPRVEEPTLRPVQVETIEPAPEPVALVEAKQAAPARGRVALRRKSPANGGATPQAHDKVDALLAETMVGIAGYCCVCGWKRGICNTGPFWGER